MNSTKYFNGTRDTWNFTPITKEGLNEILQKQAALIEACNEFYEFLESQNNDELGDLLYATVRIYDLFFSYELFVSDLDVCLDESRYKTTVSLEYIIDNKIKYGIWENIKKPVFREGKKFDLRFIESFAYHLLLFICANTANIYHIMQLNYDKLHNEENLNNRGLNLTV
jgi:hypothetical protein